VEGVEHRTGYQCGLVCNPEMTDRVEGVGKDDSLRNDLVLDYYMLEGLFPEPYCPFEPGRLARISSPILVLPLRDLYQAQTSYRREVNRELQEGP
jgi:hypothetical protein